MSDDGELLKRLGTIAIDAPPDAPPGLVDRLNFAAELIAAAPSGGGARLLWRDPGGTVRADPVGQAGLVVGRDARAGLRIDDPRLSREHFVIRPDGEDHVVQDLNSLNGVWVNQQKTSTRALCDGDILEAGGQVFVFTNDTGKP
jgi:hypothetical protein